jgi:4-aminobutyrate aminotransferase
VTSDRQGAAEGDTNRSPARDAWHARLDAETRALLDEDARWFLHQSLSTPCLDVLESATGATLTDVAGRAFLDFHGNSVHQLGHGHPRVVAAIKAQLDALPFSPRRYTNRPAITLARRLAGLFPGGPAKVLLAPSGAVAIGMALKLARLATGRHKTLSMWDSFHGATLDAISIGGEATFRRDAGPLLPGTEHLPPLDQAERFFGGDGRAFDRLAGYIDYVLGLEGDVAALIAEPIRWTTVAVPPIGFWKQVKASCERHGTLLIFDEIPSCLGRTGAMFACEHFGCAPDILVIGKGLGGGIMPMAAMIARADLDIAPHASLGHFTHEKSPVGAAAALATLDVIEEEGLVARSRSLGAAYLGRLHDFVQRYDFLTEARGLGLTLGLVVGGGDAGRRAETILYRSLERGLSFKVGGGNVLTLCPPLTITEDELDRAVSILDQACADAAA